MQKFNGIYLGIAVQNNDPEKRGRLKIFIPHISATIYDGWNNKNDAKDFTLIGNNDNETISEVIDEIKDRIPWAEPALSPVGETGNEYYSAFDNQNITGDATEDREGVTSVGEKPAKEFEDSPKEDNFSETYIPASYSNDAKGSFSIPKVGTKVWCFFQNGDLMTPVYFAISYNKKDWNSIYGEENYPANFENFSKRDGEEYDNDYKNKWVLSQRGATIEVKNTDGQENLKLTHFSGSFKEWINGKTKEFVETDDYKLVNNDQYLTVNNDQNEHVGNDQIITIGNDQDVNISNDQRINIENGQTVTIGNGNMDITVNSDGNITITGNLNLEVGGNYTIDVDGNYTLNVGGNVDINAARIDLN